MLNLKLKSVFTTIVCAVLMSFGANAQMSGGAIGLEFQAYPTGLLLGVHGTKYLGAHNAIHARVGYNFVRHGSMGVHDDERGGGFGGTLGYQYFFGKQKGFSLGIRSDVWFNEMRWMDNIGKSDQLSGVTNIVVIQPTAIAGYQFDLGKHGLLMPTISFGYEVNVVSEGADVGQGAILLCGLIYQLKI